MKGSKGLTFGDLQRGDTFDFVDDANPLGNSFHARCTKISSRRYEWEDARAGRLTAVGTLSAKVFHVEQSGSRA